MDKEIIKKYLKENLRLSVTEKKIELILDGEVISSEYLDGFDDTDLSSMLSCDCCGQRLDETQFCVSCSEPERPVCISCCSCCF